MHQHLRRMNLRGRHLRGVHLRSSFGWLLFLHLTSTVFGALFAEVQQIPRARVPIGTLKSDVEERSGAPAVHYAVASSTAPPEPTLRAREFPVVEIYTQAATVDRFSGSAPAHRYSNKTPSPLHTGGANSDPAYSGLGQGGPGK